LLGAAEALRESLGVGLAPTERETHEETKAALRAALGEDELSLEWRRGRELTLDEAVAYALQEERAPSSGLRRSTRSAT
jgi:hypothetical protein